MNTDDIIYLSLLLMSIGFGQIYRQFKSPEARKWVGSVLGILLIVVVSGYHILHPLVLTLSNICILLYGGKHVCHIISFVWSFCYLLFFRTCHYVGIQMPPSHTNAVQMMITLKLVGLCFEAHDTWRKRGELKKAEDDEAKAKLQQELEYEEIDPTPLDVFHYAFNYVGVLTGPYYKYRVYSDMLKGQEGTHVDCIQAMLKRIWVVPLYALAFLLTAHFFPLSFAEGREIFRDYNFMYRVWYMTPVFFNFRMRIYSGFVLSECVCIMAGLGAYPVSCEPKPGRGPSKYEVLEAIKKEENSKKEETAVVEYNFETIHNIDEFGADFTPTVRAGMRCWNMTVQYWLANNVYRRVKMAKPIREALTMFISAYWHGVHSGYYLSMLTVPFILAVEDYYDKLIRRRFGPKMQYAYDWFAWFWKMQNFAYMGMAFLLLRVDTTLHYWHSIGYIYHGLIILMHCIAQYVNLICTKAQYKLKKSAATALMNDEHTKVRFVRNKECEVSSEGKKDIDATSAKKAIDATSAKKAIDATSAKKAIDATSAKKAIDATTDVNGVNKEKKE